MDYPLEFITWLEEHDDLCNEQFHISAIPEYLKGHTIKKGIYNNFIPKGEGDIYTKIEGGLAFLLDRKTIDKNCFIGEKNLKSEKE